MQRVVRRILTKSHSSEEKIECSGARAASLNESSKEQQLKSSVAWAFTERCCIWRDNSDGTYLVWHPNMSSAMRTLQLKNILCTPPRGRGARLIRHHEKCHVCFLWDLYFIFFPFNWRLALGKIIKQWWPEGIMQLIISLSSQLLITATVKMGQQH